MPFSLNDGNETEVIQLVLDEITTISIVAGVNKPEVDYPDAPIGTKFYRNNGEEYVRTASTGSGVASDWDKIMSQNNFCVPVELQGGTLENIKLFSGNMPVELQGGTIEEILIVTCP